MKKKIEAFSKGETMTQYQKEVSVLLDLLMAEREGTLESFDCEFRGIGRVRVREVIDS